MLLAKRTLLLILLLALAACGFHLRGSLPGDTAYSFKSLYLKVHSETPFTTALRNALKASKVVLAPTAEQADLVLEVVSESTAQQILSLNSSGQVQEYQLFFRVSLRAYDSKQNDWLTADEIVQSRILPYDATLILEKQQEAVILNTDMRNEAVVQAIHRLRRARPHPVEQ